MFTRILESSNISHKLFQMLKFEKSWINIPYAEKIQLLGARRIEALSPFTTSYKQSNGSQVTDHVSNSYLIRLLTSYHVLP